MAFTVSPEELLEWAEIEEECDCDISAGYDYGPNAGIYLALGKNYVDREKLIALLAERLGVFLPDEETETIADSIRKHVAERVEAKLRMPVEKSAEVVEV